MRVLAAHKPITVIIAFILNSGAVHGALRSDDKTTISTSSKCDRQCNLAQKLLPFCSDSLVMELLSR